MTKDYTSESISGINNLDKDNNRNKYTVIEETEEKKKYLRIWSTNPSFKDTNNSLSLLKTTFLLILSLFIIISMYILSQQLIISIISGLLCGILFIVVFYDEIYTLKYLIPFTFRNKVSFNPFEDIVFWYNKKDSATLYLTNRRDSIHMAIRIFQITVIPENVHSAIHQFIKALSSKNLRLSYSYQIVQKPIISTFQENKSKEIAMSSLDSREAMIYFSIFYDTNGLLTNHKLDLLQYFIKKHSTDLKSNLVSNFHHFKVKILIGNSLINALRTIFVLDNSQQNNIESKKENLKEFKPNFLAKFLFFTTLVIYFDFVFFSIKLFVLYIIFINLGFIIILVMVWWRLLLFQFTKSKLLQDDDILIINPFKNVLFYHIREFPYSLFVHINNQVLIGIKMVNLKYAYQTPFCLLGKFIESLNNHKISFSYTLKNQPIDYYEFYKKGLKYLNEKQKKLMLWREETKIKDAIQAERWLSYRYGMWYSMLSMTINSYRFVNVLENVIFSEMEDELVTKIDALRGAYNINFQGYEFEDLKARNLISGYLFSTLKNNLFQLNGSHLNYVMLQGTSMYPLSTIVDILKKGTQTKIAAEFNTPLYLENYITIGHTINTEVLEPEIPVGFTFEQLKNLLIVHGISEKRNAISMKIVSELVEARVPSLIFDFTGSWSKVFSYFEESIFKNDILHFKYGSAFIIDPTKSDIPYDPHNTDYLEFVFDAFGLAFKKDERTVEMFRNTIQKNPDMDLGSIRMALQNQSEWEKSPISDTLLSLFSDFTQDDLTFFQGIQKDSILANQFIQNPKTVIIDLSVLRELNKKLFLTFIILAKIIHYVKNEGDYYEKFIFIPNIDLFFDSYFLDLKRNYDKVDLFLKPLLDNNFGLILSANQIHYLHANFLLYFNNIITLKTTDTRDVSMLRNLMNLQELEGIGYYTRSRNQTYQIRYLKNMKDNEVLIRREDIDQPFPALIDWEDIDGRKQLPYDKIVKYMEHQGFDLRCTERRILEQAKKMLFEIDLGHYIVYLDEVIKFLEEIQTIDQIGNLYKHKLKSQLKEIIYPKASQKTSKKEHLKRIRDELLNILIKHGYLIENHPRRASGSEALRTSYSVGERYQEALNDYYKTKGKVQTDINVEILEKTTKKSDLANIFQEKPRKYIVQQQNLKDAIMREFSDFNYDIFKIYSYINRGEYKSALKIEHGLIKKFLLNVLKQYYNIESPISSDTLDKFLTFLGGITDFSLTNQELLDYIEQYKVINLETNNLESLAKEVYQFIYNFFVKIQHYIYEGNGNNR
ncbi:MAG: hypothetical protein ACFE9S_04350 [Candidatus Hermodarchaeota archaeon]